MRPLDREIGLHILITFRRVPRWISALVIRNGKATIVRYSISIIIILANRANSIDRCRGSRVRSHRGTVRLFSIPDFVDSVSPTAFAGITTITFLLLILCMIISCLFR